MAKDWQFTTGVAMSCAVTALPILILLMEKLEILRQPLGQRILRYASLDDIAIWGVLALILMDWERMGKQVFFLLAFGVLSWILRRLMKAIPASDRWYVALIWLIVCALGADGSGLHFMVGAFLAGVVIDAKWFDQAQMDMLRKHVLLVMIIFANILLDKQIISSATFTALLLMAVASTMLTTPVVSPKLMRMNNQSA